MASAKSLLYENCFKIIGSLGEQFGFDPGQGPEVTKEQLKKFFPVGHIADADLVGMMQAVDPTYVVTEQDQAERKTRRALSEQARTSMFELMHNKITFFSAFATMDRGFNGLLDDSGTEGANAFNEKFAQAFALNDDGKFTSTIEDRTKAMQQCIDRITSQNYSDLFNLTDEQVVEKFPKLYSVYVMAQEGHNILRENQDDAHPDKNHYKLSAEHVNKLNDFCGQYMGVLSSMKARFDFIMNPGYELCHVERLVPIKEEHLPANAYNEDSPYEAVKNAMKTNESDIPVYQEMNDLTRAISDVFMFGSQSWADKVKHIAREKKIDPENLVFTKFDESEINIKSDKSMLGVSVFRMTDKTTGNTYALKADNGNLTVVEPENAVNMANAVSASAMTAMDAADPWYIRIFTGSKQFNEMKKAQEAVLKLRNEMGEKPGKEQLEKMNKALDVLEEKAYNYMKYKGKEIAVDAKNSERARIHAARIALTCVEDNRVLLDTYAENSKMKKVETKEKKGLLTRAQYYYASKEPGNPIAQLGNQIYDSLKDFKDNLPEEPIDVIAKMVAYDLVMRERHTEGGEVGPVEEAYRANSEVFLKCLKETNRLQEFVEGMSTERFRQFVSDATSINGISALSVNITWELKEKLQQQNQAQLQQNQQPQMETVIQNQANKPELSKQSQGSISMK